MKGFPDQPTSPMGGWYKLINERIVEARACETVADVVDLLGIPETIELDGLEATANSLLLHIGKEELLSRTNVYLVYRDPYRASKTYSFEFVGSKNEEPIELVPFKVSDIKPDRKVSESIMLKEIAAAESALNIQFPRDYDAYVSRLGEGTLASYVRVYPPSRILDGVNCVASWRERISEYWFWEEGVDFLDQDKALECVIFADTQDGDELIFHPSARNTIYVLPRYQERSFVVSSDGLESAIAWILNSGVLVSPIASRGFESFDSSK